MELMDYLINAIENPIPYSLIFFVYVVLAAVILPIPVEIGLFNPYIHPIILLLILSLGKGVGALIVFYIGAGVRAKLKQWSIKSHRIKKIITVCERFVLKYGYFGLFIIMSIPLMIDSLTLYLFSLLNPKMDGKSALTKGKFVLINMIAGATRGTIVLAVFYVFGLQLV